MNKFLSSKELAETVGLTSRRIEQLAMGAHITRQEDGFEWPDVLLELFRYYRDLRMDLEIRQSQERKKDELLAIELDRAHGKSLPKADVDRAWADIGIRIRDAFRRLGAKVSPMLLYCKSEAEMQKKIDSEVDDILTELSRPVDYQQPVELPTEHPGQP